MMTRFLIEKVNEPVQQILLKQYNSLIWCKWKKERKKIAMLFLIEISVETSVLSVWSHLKVDNMLRVKLFSNWSHITSKCSKNKVAQEAIAKYVTDVPQHFWGHLWSICEETHGNIESTCFVWLKNKKQKKLKTSSTPMSSKWSDLIKIRD